MLVETVVLAIFVGLLRKGNVKNLDLIHLRCPYLFIVSVAIFSWVTFFAGSSDNLNVIHIARIANIIQYVGLLIGIAINLNIKELWLAGAGALMNFLAIIANGGVMPMSMNALRSAGMGDQIKPAMYSHMVRHTIMTPETHMKPFADIIGLPPLPFLPSFLTPLFREVVSVGDIVVAVAVFALIQRYMCNTPSQILEISN